MTGELALHGVGMDASCLSLVPVELRTEAVCLRAVSGDGILLRNGYLFYLSRTEPLKTCIYTHGG